jgi:hypothetical protein
MEPQNDILNELKSWNSPLVGMSRIMPYQLPQGYFELLPAEIQDSIQADAAELSLPGQRIMPYNVPAGYFEGFPAQVLKAIQKEGSTILPKQMPFEAPEGYFGQLPIQILQAVKNADQKTVKTIPLYRRAAKSLRWAAAAILLLGIGIGSYKMLTPSSPVNAEKQLMAISQDEVGNYVQQNIDEFDGDMIENSVASVTPLQSVSDEDIEHYLDETGWNTSTIN